jgi:hypothetical protein
MRAQTSRPYFVILLISCSFLGACSNHDQQAPKAPASGPDQPLATGKFSEAFGRMIDTVMMSYGAMIDRFVGNDSSGVNGTAQAVYDKLNILHLDDFKTDTLVYQTAVQQLSGTLVEIKGLLGEKTLFGKRQELNMVSQDLYDLLRIIRYDRRKVYFTECATALGEDQSGDWIAYSRDSGQATNPYLGTYHSGMVHCAQVKDSLPTH